MCSVLESLRQKKRELEVEVDRVKALIARLNTAPVEMRRHHSFVFESATLITRAVDRLNRYVSGTDGSFKPLLDEMYLACITLRDRMKAIVVLCNTNEPVSHDVLHPVSTAALGACKSFLHPLSEFKCMMNGMLDEGRRACDRLLYRAKLVRAGADAILHNMSADDAESNVRHEFEHLAQFD